MSGSFLPFCSFFFFFFFSVPPRPKGGWRMGEGEKKRRVDGGGNESGVGAMPSADDPPRVACCSLEKLAVGLAPLPLNLAHRRPPPWGRGCAGGGVRAAVTGGVGRFLRRARIGKQRGRCSSLRVALDFHDPDHVSTRPSSPFVLSFLVPSLTSGILSLIVVRLLGSRVRRHLRGVCRGGRGATLGSLPPPVPFCLWSVGVSVFYCHHNPNASLRNKMWCVPSTCPSFGGWVNGACRIKH